MLEAIPSDGASSRELRVFLVGMQALLGLLVLWFPSFLVSSYSLPNDDGGPFKSFLGHAFEEVKVN